MRLFGLSFFLLALFTGAESLRTCDPSKNNWCKLPSGVLAVDFEFLVNQPDFFLYCSENQQCLDLFGSQLDFLNVVSTPGFKAFVKFADQSAEELEQHEKDMCHYLASSLSLDQAFLDQCLPFAPFASKSTQKSKFRSPSLEMPASRFATLPSHVMDLLESGSSDWRGSPLSVSNSAVKVLRLPASLVPSPRSSFSDPSSLDTLYLRVRVSRTPNNQVQVEHFQLFSSSSASSSSCFSVASSNYCWAKTLWSSSDNTANEALWAKSFPRSISSSCKWSGTVARSLASSGFHRILSTSISLPTTSTPDACPVKQGQCEIWMLEMLSASLYVDPFEIQELTRLDKWGDLLTLTSSDLATTVLGAQEHSVAELERPFSMSTQLAVSYVARFSPSGMSAPLSLQSRLPVHIRYHSPTQSESYRNLTIVPPLVALRCAASAQGLNSEKWMRVVFTEQDSDKFTVLPEVQATVPVGVLDHDGVVMWVTLGVTITAVLVLFWRVLTFNSSLKSKNQ